MPTPTVKRGSRPCRDDTARPQTSVPERARAVSAAASAKTGPLGHAPCHGRPPWARHDGGVGGYTLPGIVHPTAPGLFEIGCPEPTREPPQALHGAPGLRMRSHGPHLLDHHGRYECHRSTDAHGAHQGTMAYNSNRARTPDRHRCHRRRGRRRRLSGASGSTTSSSRRSGRQREVGPGRERLPAARRPHPEPGRDGEGRRRPEAHRSR